MSALTADLSGKRALVTGASSGFGAHFAALLAASGAQVVVGARRVEALDKLVAGIKAKGGHAEALPLDVQDPASIDALFAKVGRLDILVNNAGVGSDKAALDHTVEDFDRVIDTNLRGAFFCAQAAARIMREGGAGGSVINIASVLGLRQASHLAAYAMSKAGVIQMTKVLALEFARYGVRVNAIAPGYFDTEINHYFWDTDPGRAMIKRVPQRRLGQLDDLSGPLLLLASDASRFMTGSVIAVDGGHLVSTL